MADPVTSHPLAPFIGKVSKFKTIRSEQNLFSLGARGHFENPTSDLLAFFLNPLEDHGLGTLFLDALAAASGTAEQPIVLPPASFSSIRREVITEDGKFIDLVIEGGDWLMLVENKIHSGQGNPFLSYESYAEAHHRGRTLILLILSPHGGSASANWRPVTYRALCGQVKQRMSAALWTQPPTKWHFFAREFIIHLETLLYQQPMKSEDYQFVLGHLSEFRKARRMADEFLVALADIIKTKLGTVEGLSNATARTNYNFITPENWAIRCHAGAWGDSNIALYPLPQDDATGFYLTIYAVSLTQEQIVAGNRSLEALCQMEYRTEGNHPVWSCWETAQKLEMMDDALECLMKLAHVMNGLMGVGGTSSTTATALTVQHPGLEP